QHGGRIVADPQFKQTEGGDCASVPIGFAAFPAHSSPLGFDYFDSTATDPRLKDRFLVALHGSSKRRLGRGYRISSVTGGGRFEDFLTGFLVGTRVQGRPADVLRMGPDSFLLTDDYAGAVFYVFKKPQDTKKEPGRQ